MQRVAISLTVVFMAAAPLAVAADLDATIAGCNDCHGNNGVSQWNDVPTIAGLSEYFHADQLYYFRDGERPCSESKYRQGDTSRPATTMCAVTADLADEDLDAIGAHYAELPFVAAKQEFDAGLAATGEAIHEEACGRCHTDGGSNPGDDAGILAGQWMGYLESAIAQYRAGERNQMEAMKDKIDALSDDDVKALLHYYASQQ